MTIKYKIIKTSQPGVKGGGKYSYQARITNRRKVNLVEIAGIISDRCTLRRSDVTGVLTELTELIPQLLLENCGIQLGDFGTFSLHAGSKPSETPEKVNETKITGLRVAFRPGKMVKKELQLAKFSRRL